jgi:ribosome-binding protein aMBF1 (putative translation factor)
MKARHTKDSRYIDVRVGMPDGKETSYHIPSSARQKLNSFLKELDVSKSEITPWEEATPWEVLAKDRIKKYKKAGLVLRGARYRENMSQVKLAQMSGVHQNEISKIENGRRGVGEKVAKKLAKPLKINYLLLLEDDIT